ncbi:MAG: SpoIID/LytB domain-containing protein, partial [Oscillospiraceae bacterium]|nr:SpoIID/LytB domain-containing protein [Oscillospiraceae bacterium]
ALYNGKVAQTAYYSSNGGASESSSTVWGGSQANYPYLVGKVDPYEASAGVKNDYTKTVSSDTLVAGLKKLGYNDVGKSIVSVAITSLTDSGNPKQIAFTDSNGKQFTINTRYVKSMLGLQSYRYGLETGVKQPSGPKVSVNGSTLTDSAGLCAIAGEGNVVPVGGDAYVITDSGVTQLELGSGDGTGSSSSLGVLASTKGNNGMFTFVGKGWGHNVGLSQWGAYAMAKQGYTYLDILQFYYTGITVGYM